MDTLPVSPEWAELAHVEGAGHEAFPYDMVSRGGLILLLPQELRQLGSI